MQEDSAAQDALTNKIMKRVFGDVPVPNFAAFQERFIDDLRLPRKVTCQLTGKPTWTSLEDETALFADQAAVETEASKHDWLYPKQAITSEQHLMQLLQRSNFAEGGRAFDASDVFASDDIARSHHIYNSINVIDSSNIVSCSWIWESEYLLGCARSGNSSYSVGLVEGVKCSDSFKVYSSHNIVKSMFIKNSFDLYECLFCAHLKHKKFCIANMQYEETEYRALKATILRWIFDAR